MTAQIIAYGLFLVVLGLMGFWFWWSTRDDEFEEVEEFEAFQRDAHPLAYGRPPASPRRSR